MKVKDVLKAMAGAYRGFDADAVAAMAAVFQRKLERYEGAELANAWVEVAASFAPKAAKPYPAPADFEDVLPRAAKMPKGADGHSLDREGHKRRAGELVADWQEWERRQIAEAYGPRVAFWCESEVRSRADTLGWDDEVKMIRLGDDAVAKIFASVVSRDRMAAYAGWPIGRLSAPLWQEQMEICRAHVLAGRYSADEIAVPVQSSPRRAMQRPTVDLRADEFETVGEPPAWLENVPDSAEVAE